jgi:hypothetical protein
VFHNIARGLPEEGKVLATLPSHDRVRTDLQDRNGLRTWKVCERGIGDETLFCSLQFYGEEISKDIYEFHVNIPVTAYRGRDF